MPAADQNQQKKKVDRRMTCWKVIQRRRHIGSVPSLQHRSQSRAANVMPEFCAAYGCNTRRSIDTRSRGITFHKFPSDTGLRRRWEVALRREGFVATKWSKLCSEHFKPVDFDRTGQIVRLRDGVIPSVFNFLSHLQRPVVTKNTKTSRKSSRKAEESLPVDLSQHKPESEPQPNDPVVTRNTKTSRKALKKAEESLPVDLSQQKPESEPQPNDPGLTRDTETSRKAEESLPLDLSQHKPESEPQPNDDHSYALPDSPTHLKARLSEALARVESLEREKHNLKARERRAKKTVKSLLEDLKKKKLINEELKDRLDFYSGIQIDLFSKRGHEYTMDQREFALTLHLHGPKAYSYLRDSLHLPLPHPNTLQRWTQSVDAKPGLNTTSGVQDNGEPPVSTCATSSEMS